MRNFLREWLPPLLKRKLQRFLNKYGWFGDFPSWQAASARCAGYQKEEILERVKAAALKVRDGLAVHERDSVVFSEPQYSWPLLAGLLYIAAKRNGELCVLDFGGSLGSTYYQNRHFLRKLRSVRWCIVEQEHFVRCGKAMFENEIVKFYYTISDCTKAENIDVLLLSSVIQYLPDPQAFMNEVLNMSFDYILIDRTGFSDDGCEHITVQKVNQAIYPASYPCYFFSHSKFCALLTQFYDIIAEFPGNDKIAYPATFRGFILQRK